jgi:aldehyde dehydrogenase (NAD+)
VDQHQNYIAGEWVAGADQTVNRNPSDLGDVVGHYARASAEQAKDAIAAAVAAAPAWAAFNIQERAALLEKVGNTILQQKDELGKLLSREEGKTLPEGVG